jgi:putative glutamine amidotransferase
MKPLIGLTTYGRNDFDEDTPRFCTPAAYCDAVARAGGMPVLVPPCQPDFETLAARFDGFVLIGGGDVDPSHYGGNPHETIYMTDAERDGWELDFARRLSRSDLPALCICRGCQVLNVALGGTLIEHLPDEVGEEILHRAPPRKPTEHPVAIEPSSKLAELVGGASCNTVSWHHQALREVGQGLSVVARAADGTIEAVELPGHPFLIAVQWHPELAAHQDPVQQGLFNRLVDAARRRISR